MNYFNKSEFACKCGCGLDNINSMLVEELNIARAIADTPFVITSGCRCEMHNKNVGGLAGSAHTKGLAVDIRTNDSRERFKILQALMLCKFERIGINRHFIHVDIDETKPFDVAWMY